MNKEVQDLQEALEYQVNVILRLEDEQLLLQKENNLQKEKLKELNSMLQKYIGQQLFNFEVQTQENEIISDYSLCNSIVSVINQPSFIQQQDQSNSSKMLDQAKSLVKQSSQRIPIKKLKFFGDNYKENKDKDNQEKKEIKPKNTKKLDSQYETLTKDIVNLTKQLQQLKVIINSISFIIKKLIRNNQEI